MKRFTQLWKLAVAGLMLLSCGAPTAQAAQKVRWYVPMGYASLGVNYHRVYDAFNSMVKGVAQKTGYDGSLEILHSHELAMKRGKPGNVVAMDEAMRLTREKKAELIYLYPEEYMLHDVLRQQLTPFLGWTVKGQTYGQACLFVDKRRGLKGVAALKGKRLNGLTDYVTVRRLLFEGGVNEPLEKFFGGFDFHANPAVALEKLLKGETDAAYMGWQKWLFVQKQKPEFKNAGPLVCRPGEPMVFLATRRDMPPAVLDKLAQVLANAHRDPSFATVRWFFLAFQGSLFRTPPDYLKQYEAAFEDARKRGWATEAKRWFDTSAPARFKAWAKTHPQPGD